MPSTLKRNAILIAAMAGLFYWGFMFAKHDPALRDVIPFGEDPYDAVGSFAAILAVLLAAFSMVRAFRPYRALPSPIRQVFLLRTQMAVVMAVWFTLAADVVAMGRHPAMWMEAASRRELLGLIAGLAIAATLVQVVLQRTPGAPGSASSMRAGIVPFLGLLMLALYPEQLIRQVGTHLLTIIVACLLLFATIRAGVIALAPLPSPVTVRPGNARRQWAAVALLGVLLGLFAFFGEMSEGGGTTPVARAAAVAAVFVGISLAGLLLAYAFVGKPLGIGQSA